MVQISSSAPLLVVIMCLEYYITGYIETEVSDKCFWRQESSISSFVEVGSHIWNQQLFRVNQQWSEGTSWCSSSLVWRWEQKQKKSMEENRKYRLFLHFYVFLLHLKWSGGCDLWDHNGNRQNRPTDTTLTGNNGYNSLNFKSPVLQMLERCSL